MSIEIEVGKTYRRSRYEGGETVRVTGINPNDRGWYDDHMEGGWFTKGVAEYEFLTGLDPRWDSNGWVSLDYAKDNWKEVK